MKAQFPRLSLAHPAPLPVRLDIRFRLFDSYTWHEGRVEDLAEAGMVFLSDLALEVGTYLELELVPAGRAALDRAMASASNLPSNYARVERRVLDRWPDLRTAIAIQFLAVPRQVSGAA